MATTPLQLSGSLLLASPTLRDGIFDHSVVLVAEHSKKDGAFGVILNHPTGREVGQFLDSPEFAPLSRIPVHVGGPVAQDQLVFAAFSQGPDNQLNFAMRLPVDQAVAKAKSPGVVVRAFIGYSGWTAGQLEGELKRDAWITTSPDSSLPGRQHDQSLWRELLQSISPFHRILAEAPADPGRN